MFSGKAAGESGLQGHLRLDCLNPGQFRNALKIRAVIDRVEDVNEKMSDRILDVTLYKVNSDD